MYVGIRNNTHSNCSLVPRMEQKIANALSRLAANYLREPMGVRQPPVNGVEVIEQRELVEVRVSCLFRDPTDLSLAREITELGSVDSRDSLEMSYKVSNDRLEVSFKFHREKMLGSPLDVVQRIASSLVSFGDRLKTEVLSSKVRLSHDIRTAIAQTSRLYASHASVGARGA